LKIKTYTKTFGDFKEIVYNKNMKRLGNVLLSILLIVPMFVGMCFMTPECSPVTLNGGGGGKSFRWP